jgi:hypothetical protein
MQERTGSVEMGALQWLEARHRAHAQVEDRIRCAKDTGLGRMPSREFAINAAWCTAAAIAADLIAWLQLLALDGDLACAEPKRLRLPPAAHRRSPRARPTPPLATHPGHLALGYTDHRRVHPDRGHPRPRLTHPSRYPNNRRTQETTPTATTDGPSPCPADAIHRNTPITAAGLIRQTPRANHRG